MSREEVEHAHIRMRSGGRQIVIQRGKGAKDVEDDEGNEHEQSSEANGPDAPAKRGKVTGFSEDSRRRLRDRLHALRRDAGGLFVTLTYHESAPDPEEAKADLEAFWKRLRRRFPSISAVWKMEPQDRGEPHFHLMIFGVEFLPVQWLSQAWHDVTGEDSDAHEAGGVDLEPFLNEDGKLQGYMSKYMGEEYDHWPGTEEGDPWHTPGRWWGVLSRENLPMAGWDDAAVYVDEADATKLISDLLERWDTDLPDGVIPPSLTINTRGDPGQVLEDLLGRL